jgi:hypothetical protein
MKYLPCIFIAGALLAVSCKKNNTDVPLLASVNVVHAVVNAPTVKVNTTGATVTYLTFADSINYGAAKAYAIPGRANVPFAIVSTKDTTKPLFNASFAIGEGETYSLFLAGQYPQCDTVWVRDYISNYTDSLVGVRFINLSPNSSAININIKGNTGLEATGLAYKQITAFKTYPAKSTNGSYIFEVRDAATGNLLTTFTLTIARFHNHTLVIKGLAGATGTNALGIFAENHF